jgi:hypothetical protein
LRTNKSVSANQSIDFLAEAGLQALEPLAFPLRAASFGLHTALYPIRLGSVCGLIGGTVTIDDTGEWLTEVSVEGIVAADK